MSLRKDAGRIVRRTLICVVGLAVIVALAAMGHAWRVHRLQRECFESVVAQVRSKPIAPGESELLMLTDLSDPRSLRPYSDAFFEETRQSNRTGTVIAFKTDKGQLGVIIEVADYGHGGATGYAYLEPAVEAPTPEPGHILFGGWLIDRRMDGVWWRVDKGQ